jgi:hypothetical protein
MRPRVAAMGAIIAAPLVVGINGVGQAGEHVMGVAGHTLHLRGGHLGLVELQSLSLTLVPGCVPATLH